MTGHSLNAGVVGRLMLVGAMLSLFHCSAPEKSSPPPISLEPDEKGCGSPDNSKCRCDVKTDCAPRDHPERAKYFVCSPIKQCHFLCLADSDCASGQTCEDAECRDPGCATNAECGSGLTCQSGRCAAPATPSEVASCELTPSAAVLHTGVTRSFQLVARDQAGNVLSILPGSSGISWDPEGTGTLTPDTDFATLTGGPGAVSGVLHASIGSVECTGASITNFASVPENQFRVVVVSKEAEALVSDARVVVNGHELTTGENGSYVFENIALPATVTVAHPTRSNVMLLDVATNDVLVDLKAEHPLVKLQGEMTPRSFDALRDIRGTVHVAIARASFTGNLDDLGPTDLVGNDSVETTIGLGGSTQYETRLGEGLVLGLAENMFKGKYSVSARRGSRTISMIGGNIQLSDVFSAAGPISGDTGKIDVFVGVLPLLAHTGFAAQPFRRFGEDGPLAISPADPLRMHVTVKAPALPSYDWNGEHIPLQEAMLIGGLRHPSQGFVAVGFSAAFDEDRDGRLDASLGGGAGEIPVNLGPAPRGLERSPVQFSALFVEKNKLSGERGSHPLAYSGLVSSPALRRLKEDAASTVTLPDALALPAQVSLDVTNDRFEHSGLDAATLMRLDLGTGWSVYFPATRKVVDLTGLTLDAHTTATLHALRLGRKLGVDYQAALRFDGDDLDDLNGVLDAFSVRPLTESEVTH